MRYVAGVTDEEISKAFLGPTFFLRVLPSIFNMGRIQRPVPPFTGETE